MAIVDYAKSKPSKVGGTSTPKPKKLAAPKKAMDIPARNNKPPLSKVLSTPKPKPMSASDRSTVESDRFQKATVKGKYMSRTAKTKNASKRDSVQNGSAFQTHSGKSATGGKMYKGLQEQKSYAIAARKRAEKIKAGK